MKAAARVVEEFNKRYPNPDDITLIRYYANLCIMMANILEANGIVDEQSIKMLTDKAHDAVESLRRND